MNDNIRQRAFNAVLSSAVFSWQSAVTLAVTLILFFGVDLSADFSWWQNWYWLILGALTEVAFVIGTLSDPDAAEDALARQFERQYDLNTLRSAVSRERLRSALEYRRNMMELARQARGALRVSLMQTVDDINDWIGHMYDLGIHIDAFEANELVERDRRMVPQQIEKTRQRMERERDAAVRRDLERQVEQLEQQLANLEATVNSVRRAEIQLESTLSSLGTIYAQMARLGTAEVDSGRAQRLRLEIQDEVAGLQDTIEAMDEVQAQHLRLR
jgi:hypothetical protein